LDVLSRTRLTEATPLGPQVGQAVGGAAQQAVGKLSSSMTDDLDK